MSWVKLSLGVLCVFISLGFKEDGTLCAIFLIAGLALILFA